MGPYVIHKNEELPPETQKILIVCSNGCFAQPFVLKTLITALSFSCRYVLILAEEDFRIPGATFKDDHRAFAKLVSDDTDLVLDLVVSLFTEIAVVFQPKHFGSTESILAAKALQIYSRCMNKTGCKYLGSRNS